MTRTVSPDRLAPADYLVTTRGDFLTCARSRNDDHSVPIKSARAKRRREAGEIISEGGRLAEMQWRCVSAFGRSSRADECTAHSAAMLPEMVEAGRASAERSPTPPPA